MFRVNLAILVVQTYSSNLGEVWVDLVIFINLMVNWVILVKFRVYQAILVIMRVIW